MRPIKSILCTVAADSCVTAQNSEVKLGKHSTAIPKVCESVAPAFLEGQLDVQGAVKEASRKGAGLTLLLVAEKISELLLDGERVERAKALPQLLSQSQRGLLCGLLCSLRTTPKAST